MSDPSGVFRVHHHREADTLRDSQQILAVPPLGVTMGCGPRRTPEGL
ncbi:hypothetical protein H5U98_06905 [Mycolicibacterium boenickei]|uniref:Uncharacterized protein n=1 Tax=Mycolicibacterium boenickei TaxID=146017 RepID=A0AAX3A0C9_9MYCO|nr:hypothetical protein [Mycolicibacterium boenickei]UNC01117.1 hypothetical protein H5U98_06905 [Mycolicibacterium boenickei]